MKFRSVVLVSVITAILTSAATMLIFSMSQSSAGIGKSNFHIRSPGNYHLNSTLRATELGIRIRSNNVNLDLGGHCILGVNADEKIDLATQSTGIIIDPGLKNIRIYNGCVSGFMYGIDLPQHEPTVKRHDYETWVSQNIVIENLTLSKNTFRGISIWGDFVKIAGNHVFEMGGTTVNSDSFAIGIELGGNSSRISGNTVMETYGRNSGEGVGISISKGGWANLVEDNYVANTAYQEFGRTFGIWIGRNPRSKSIVKGNTVNLTTYGIAGHEKLILPDNLIVDELCTEKVSTAPLQFSARKVTTLNEPCPDAIEPALAKISKENVNSIFRVAMLYNMKGNWLYANAFYKIASELGSDEAATNFA